MSRKFRREEVFIQGNSILFMCEIKQYTLKILNFIRLSKSTKIETNLMNPVLKPLAIICGGLVSYKFSFLFIIFSF